MDTCSTCLCEQCAALCCRYFALPIDNPKTARQYDDIRWYLCHENVVVFIEEKQWYIGIMSRCKHLQPDNRCGIYEKRPKVCREYTTENCDYHGGEYNFEKLFTSAEQLAAYARQTLRARRLRLKRKQAKGEPAAAAAGGRRAGVRAHLSKARRRAATAEVGVMLPVVGGEGRIALPVLGSIKNVQ